MKLLLFCVFGALGFGLVGCETDEGERVRPVRQVGEKFGEGLRGEGEIVEVDRSEDPFVR